MKSPVQRISAGSTRTIFFEGVRSNWICPQDVGGPLLQQVLALRAERWGGRVQPPESFLHIEAATLSIDVGSTPHTQTPEHHVLTLGIVLRV